MKLLTKKWLVWLLAIMMILPAWAASAMIGATPAMAASWEKVFNKTNVDIHKSSDWNNGPSGEIFTWGSVDNSYIKADNAIDKHDQDAGLYKIEAEWLVWDNHTKDASYEISQGSKKLTIDDVDQSKKADGTAGANGTLSGYRTLTDNYHFYGKNDVDIKLFGENGDNRNTSFVHFRVSFVSEDVAPSAPVLIAPSDGSYTNLEKPTFQWEPSTDPDDTSILYELFVYQVGKSSPLIHEDEIADTSYTAGISLLDKQYSWYVRAFDGEKYSSASGANLFIVDTEKPTDPTALTATINGDSVELSWDPSTDENGVLGYNVYREASPAVLLNPSPIFATTYVDQPDNGIYNYYVTSVDLAGNESGKSNIIDHLSFSFLAAPVISVTHGNDKDINVAFDGVGRGITDYYIYVNGVLAKAVSATSSDAGVKYQFNIPVAAYGDYEVRVVALDIYGNMPSSLPVKITLKAPVAIVAPAVVTASTLTETVISAPSNQAITPSSSVSNPAASGNLDDQGKIKAAEETPSDDNGKINWTPWIILFILILLAGAATGGYFYWFGGEEGAAATVAIKEKTILTPVSKKKNGDKKPAAKPTKKSRRW